MSRKDRYPGLNEAITSRYEEEGPSKISEEFGVSNNLVEGRAFTRGVKSKNQWKRSALGKRRSVEERDKELVAEIRKRYKDEGAKKVAEQYSCSQSRVRFLAFTLGIKRENCDHTVFDDLLSSEAAYFLGLIWADGCIHWESPKAKHTHELEISLTESEWPLLYALRDFLKASSEHYISKSYKGQRSRKRSRTLSIGNKVLVSKLIDRGIVPRKSYVDPHHPAGIPDELYHHFARGWLDGDGSISYGKKNPRKIPEIAWLGSKRALVEFRDKFSNLCGISEKKIGGLKHSSSCFRVSWAAKFDVAKIMKYLHKDGGIFAERKHRRPIRQFLNFRFR